MILWLSTSVNNTNQHSCTEHSIGIIMKSMEHEPHTQSDVLFSYALASIAPVLIQYKITEKGIWIDEVFYRFSELSEYWFETHLEVKVLVVTLPQRKIGRILLVVPN